LPYVYTSSKPAVVKVLVATSGTIQGVADGTATITVHDSNSPQASKQYQVTVSGNTRPLIIDTTPAAITGTETLVRNASGGVLPYVYTSSKPAVVKVLVATSGTIQGVADGTATITVHDSNSPQASKQYQVTVSGNTRPLIIDTTPAAITGTEALVRNASGGVLPYVYTSSEPAVVKVVLATSGTIQGVTDGTATITVHDSHTPQASASYTVTVSGNTSPLTIDTAGVALAMGEELTRKASGGALPYVYKSSDPNAVVVVDPTSGVIRGITYLTSGSGSADISVTDKVGQTASYRVQVVPAVAHEALSLPLAPIGNGIRTPWMYIESTVPAGRGTSAIIDGEESPPYFSGHRIKVHMGTVGSGSAPLRFRLLAPFREVTVAALSQSDSPSKMQAYSASGVLLDEIALPTTSPRLITVRATTEHRIEDVRFVSTKAPDGPVFIVVDNVEFRG